MWRDGINKKSKTRSEYCSLCFGKKDLKRKRKSNYKWKRTSVELADRDLGTSADGVTLLSQSDGCLASMQLSGDGMIGSEETGDEEHTKDWLPFGSIKLLKYQYLIKHVQIISK